MIINVKQKVMHSKAVCKQLWCTTQTTRTGYGLHTRLQLTRLRSTDTDIEYRADQHVHHSYHAQASLLQSCAKQAPFMVTHSFTAKLWVRHEDHCLLDSSNAVAQLHDTVYTFTSSFAASSTALCIEPVSMAVHGRAQTTFYNSTMA
jgi:hypothetical protein